MGDVGSSFLRGRLSEINKALSLVLEKLKNVLGILYIVCTRERKEHFRVAKLCVIFFSLFASFKRLT